MSNTTLSFSTFNFDSITNAVMVEGLEHIKSYLEDTDFSGYFCDLSSESIGCDPYVIYHASAKQWISDNGLDTFDVIDDVKEYHTQNFGGFTLEVTPVNIVTAYMDVVLSDIVGCWLNNRMEEEHNLDLWDDEITDETRPLLLKLIEEEIEAFENNA